MKRIAVPKKKASKTPSQSFRVLGLFIIVVVLLLFLSGLVKVVALYLKSEFDGKHRYSIAFVSKPVTIISFSPETKTISKLTLPSEADVTKLSLGKKLYIPINGYVKEHKTDTPIHKKEESINKLFQTLLFSFPMYETDMTIFDAVRMFLFVSSVQSHNVIEKTLEQPLDTIDSARIDKTVSSLFSDETILDESISIQILNASTRSGVGNDIARVLTNMGANIISVKTSPKKMKKTTIRYSGKVSYTVKKIETVLGKKAGMLKKGESAAVIITIGEDFSHE